MAEREDAEIGGGGLERLRRCAGLVSVLHCFAGEGEEGGGGGIGADLGGEGERGRARECLCVIEREGGRERGKDVLMFGSFDLVEMKGGLIGFRSGGVGPRLAGARTLLWRSG